MPVSITVPAAQSAVTGGGAVDAGPAVVSIVTIVLAGQAPLAAAPFTVQVKVAPVTPAATSQKERAFMSVFSSTLDPARAGHRISAIGSTAVGSRSHLGIRAATRGAHRVLVGADRELVRLAALDLNELVGLVADRQRAV